MSLDAGSIVMTLRVHFDDHFFAEISPEKCRLFHFLNATSQPYLLKKWKGCVKTRN